MVVCTWARRPDTQVRSWLLPLFNAQQHPNIRMHLTCCQRAIRARRRPPTLWASSHHSGHVGRDTGCRRASWAARSAPGRHRPQRCNAGGTASCCSDTSEKPGDQTQGCTRVCGTQLTALRAVRPLNNLVQDVYACAHPLSATTGTTYRGNLNTSRPTPHPAPVTAPGLSHPHGGQGALPPPPALASPAARLALNHHYPTTAAASAWPGSRRHPHAGPALSCSECPI